MVEFTVFLLLNAALLFIPQVKAEQVGGYEILVLKEKPREISIDGQCFRLTEGILPEGQESLWLKCDDPMDKGLNIPNCYLMGGEWNKGKEACELEGYYYFNNKEKDGYIIEKIIKKRGLEV